MAHLLAPAHKKKPATERPNDKFYNFRSTAGIQRTIRVVDAQNDPLEPPKFKHKRAPAGPPSPPAPVMHSPAKKLSAADQQAWKLPPCISNWKNPKGFTIPLDKRLAADGRGLVESTMSDGHAQLAEALYSAERAAREEVDSRQALANQAAVRVQVQRERELAQMAAEVIGESNRGSEFDRARREGVAEERLRRNQRPERERDIAERVMLGQAAPSSMGDDARLYAMADQPDKVGQLGGQSRGQYRANKERIDKEMRNIGYTSGEQEADPFNIGGLLGRAEKRKWDTETLDDPAAKRRQ